MLGVVISWLFYFKKAVDPETIKRQFAGVHNFLVEKWQFDNIYDAMFMRPVHIVSRWAQAFDRVVIDRGLHALSSLTVLCARWDRVFDEKVVDRIVNILGETTFSVGRSLRGIQTGRLRQYVMFIVAGVLCLFILLFAFLPRG